MSVLRLSDAMRRTVEAGLTARIMAGFGDRDRSIRIALNTLDPDPHPAMSINNAREELILVREQSGPERWDYLVHDNEPRERYFLRIESDSRNADVSILPAGFSILSAH